VLGVALHQLAPQHQGVLAGGVRDLVDEARDVDRVLVQIHAEPEARRRVRVAHRVVDEQVRDAVAKHDDGQLPGIPKQSQTDDANGVIRR
jgi:DNA-binding FrmR family transcriptional regulator